LLDRVCIPSSAIKTDCDIVFKFDEFVEMLGVASNIAIVVFSKINDDDNDDNDDND